MAKRRKKSGDTPPVGTRIAKLLELPESALLDVPTIELSSNSEAIIDGCKGVIEYSETTIRLGTGRQTIRITGRGLQLRAMAAESVVITGYIRLLEFLD